LRPTDRYCEPASQYWYARHALELEAVVEGGLNTTACRTWLSRFAITETS